MRSRRERSFTPTRAAALALACALGCEGAGGGASTSGPSDDDTTGGSTTTEGGTTFGDTQPCVTSEECDDGVCVAPYDPGAGSGRDGMGLSVCVPSCVPADALTLWCTDDASCCDGLECRAIDGFCIGAAGTSGDSTVGETWVVESSDDGSSTDSSSSTSSGSSDTGATGSESGTGTTGR
jgi:hypothetical protein